MAQEVEVKIKVATDQAVNDINKVSESFVSLKTQLRQAQNEVTALSEKFGATSKEAVQAAKRAGELKDKIGDAKALTDAFNPDAKFKALSASLTGVAGGFSVVTGAMGAFGANTKEVEEQLLKVQSAMAISSGLQAVGESVDSFKQLGAVIKSTSLVQGIYNFVQTGSLTITKANTVATEAQAVATTASAVATSTATSGMKLFRIALIGTGIGAIVVALGLLIANFDKVKETVLRVIPGLKAVGEFIGNVVDSITDFVGATSDATRALDKLKANAENTLAVNKKFMQEHGDQVDAYTKKKIDAKNAYAEAVKEDGADQVALAKRLNRELADIEFSRGDEKRKIQKDANEKASANKKADNEKAIAEELANQIKFDEETKTGLEILNKAKLDRDIEDSVNKRNLLDEQIALLNEGVDAEQQAETRITENAKENSEKRIGIEQAYQDAKRNALDTGLGILQQFAGKNKAVALGILAIQKGLAIADIVVGASKSIATATASIAQANALAAAASPLTAGQPFVGINTAMGLKGILSTKIAAATGIASILAAGIGQASSITGGGGGSAGGGGGGVSAPAPAQFNVVGPQGSNQIAQTLAGGQQQPIQAYVVAGAVTTSQSLNRNIINNASMG